METVAIVGVGLIGGSFALALRQAGFVGRIIGVSSPRTIAKALERGVIGEGLPLEEAVPRADLVYLSQPILSIIDVIPKLDGLVKTGCLVTDAGSTKAEIVAAARTALRRAQFLGGHPMAGKESRGVEVAEAGLFAGKTYVLTPEREADLDTPAAQEFIEWIKKIGVRLLVLSPEEHDRTVAFTSHLPQLVSTALAATLSRQLPEGSCAAAGPGLAGMTRLAASPYEIWKEIIATNQAPIEDALGAYLEALQAIKSQLSTSLEREFREAAEFRARWMG